MLQDAPYGVEGPKDHDSISGACRGDGRIQRGLRVGEGAAPGVAALRAGAPGLVQLRGRGDVIHAYLLPIGLMLLAWGIWQLVRRRTGKPVGALVRVALALAVLAWYWFTDEVPAEFTNMTPYIATLLVLALSAQRLRMPAADGQVYRKGEAN